MNGMVTACLWWQKGVSVPCHDTASSDVGNLVSDGQEELAQVEKLCTSVARQGGVSSELA